MILMTSDRNLDTAIAALREGAFDYLKKPVQIQELLTCIQKM
jgi:DNA-binding NtrC family response regulator